MRFRPGDLPAGDPSEPDSPVEWEDNWPRHDGLRPIQAPTNCSDTRTLDPE